MLVDPGDDRARSERRSGADHRLPLGQLRHRAHEAQPGGGTGVYAAVFRRGADLRRRSARRWRVWAGMVKFRALQMAACMVGLLGVNALDPTAVDSMFGGKCQWMPMRLIGSGRPCACAYASPKSMGIPSRLSSKILRKPAGVVGFKRRSRWEAEVT